MIVGDTDSFAIESEMTEVKDSISQRALGFFVIHICGQQFGIKEPDASMLGSSLNEVEERLQRRGTHCVPRLAMLDAAKIVDAYLDAIYRNTTRTDYLGLSKDEFAGVLYSSAIIWAPDGDEAFDDGSHVLQFDLENKVRLIAFINTAAPACVAETIKEIWIEAGHFYDVLSRWNEQFVAEWKSRLGKGP